MDVLTLQRKLLFLRNSVFLEKKKKMTSVAKVTEKIKLVQLILPNNVPIFIMELNNAICSKNSPPRDRIGKTSMKTFYQCFVKFQVFKNTQVKFLTVIGV